MVTSGPWIGAGVAWRGQVVGVQVVNAVVGLLPVRFSPAVKLLALPTRSARTSRVGSVVLVAAGTKLIRASVMVAPWGMPTSWKRRAPILCSGA
ncbi:hypothetical protein D3C81_2100450 [compost metagenome]